MHVCFFGEQRMRFARQDRFRSCAGFRPPAIGVRGETVIPAAENLHGNGPAEGGTL